MFDDQRVRFRGQEYLLSGGGSIYSILNGDRAYEVGDYSYAVLSNGRIMRYGQQIGTEDDLEFLDE